MTPIIMIPDRSVGSPPIEPVRMWNDTGQPRAANAAHNGPHREGPQPVDGEDMAVVLVLHHAGGPVGKGTTRQARRPEVVGLEDVAVGGDDPQVAHDALPRSKAPGRASATSLPSSRTGVPF